MMAGQDITDIGIETTLTPLKEFRLYAGPEGLNYAQGEIEPDFETAGLGGWVVELIGNMTPAHFQAIGAASSLLSQNTDAAPEDSYDISIGLG